MSGVCVHECFYISISHSFVIVYACVIMCKFLMLFDAIIKIVKGSHCFELFLVKTAEFGIYFGLNLVFVSCENCSFVSAFVDYRYKKDEIFRRIKVTVFAQLVSEEAKGDISFWCDCMYVWR